MKGGGIPKRFVFIFLKICKIFKKIKTNHHLPIAACIIKQSAEKGVLPSFHVYHERKVVFGLVLGILLQSHRFLQSF
jgi:hypothetical protein